MIKYAIKFEVEELYLDCVEVSQNSKFWTYRTDWNKITNDPKLGNWAKKDKLSNLFRNLVYETTNEDGLAAVKRHQQENHSKKGKGSKMKVAIIDKPINKENIKWAASLVDYTGHCTAWSDFVSKTTGFDVKKFISIMNKFEWAFSNSFVVFKIRIHSKSVVSYRMWPCGWLVDVNKSKIVCKSQDC